jgi:hypothetical protein
MPCANVALTPNVHNKGNAMSFAWLPCVVLCLASGQETKLQLDNVRMTYGHLGALRPKTGLLPGDTAFFTFEIKNLKLDDGKASYSIAIEIHDEQGKLLYEQKPYNSVAQNFFGGNSLPCSARVELPFDSKAGGVDWKVTVIDRKTKQTASLAGKGKVLPADFGVVHVGLFADPEMRVPTSPVNVVGDSAYLHFSALGFGRDKEKKQPDLHVSMRILDEQGKPTMTKPITGQVNSDVPADARYVPMQFGLSLNRAGRFTVEVTAEDRVSGKTSTISYALRVLPLE